MLVQLAFKKRQYNAHRTPVTSHSAKHYQHAIIIAGLPPISQNIHMYWAEEVMHSIHLYVYDFLKIERP